MDPILAFKKSHTNSYGKYIRTRVPPNAADKLLQVRDEFQARSDACVARGEAPLFLLVRFHQLRLVRSLHAPHVWLYEAPLFLRVRFHELRLVRSLHVPCSLFAPVYVACRPLSLKSCASRADETEEIFAFSVSVSTVAH